MKTVAEFFLEWEFDQLRNSQNITEMDYFSWRLVFDYWIKGTERRRIKEIETPIFVKLLELEFPEEMVEIFKL